MPTVLDWSPAVDPSDLLRFVHEAISTGSPVVLPGDCGYVVLVNPAGPQAIAQLESASGVMRSSTAILAWSPDDPLGLGLAIPRAIHRLLSRGWPAPLVIQVPGQPDWPTEWAPAVRKRVQNAGPINFRCPEHPIFDTIAPGLEFPVLVVDTFLSTAEEALDLVNDSESMAISAGSVSGQERPTVVTVVGSGAELSWKISERGLLSVDEIEKLTSRIILFVCTGNTCRSPLAEGLAKRMLADRLNCEVRDLPERGFWLVSAGVSASNGSPAANEAIAVAAELGCELSDHQSRSVNPQLLAAADEVIAMTRSHSHALASRYPGIGPVPTLLCGDEDLDDPIGSGLGVYRDCARAILLHLERFLPAWVGS